MPLITVADVSLAYGGRDVLSHISVRLDAGDRVGLVGSNGAGKTSLLRVIAGEERPNGGQVALAGGSRLGYVPQIPHVTPGRSVREEVLSGIAHLAELEHEIEAAAHALTEAQGEAVAAAADHYDALTRRFEAEGGYRYRVEAEEILAGLRLPERLWHQPAAGMSGGEKSRIALARVLLAKPDVLLLDEPTNHLDIAGIGWLEGFLSRWPGAVVVVSHDRFFLDRVATEIWDLRRERLMAYRGNYSAYVQQRDEQLARQRDQYERQREKIEREEELIRRYKEGQRARWARGLQTRLNRMERLERPQEEKSVAIRLGKASRTGRIALLLDDVVIAQPGNPTHELLRFPHKVEVQRGERVAIVGDNGTGKTTLLRTLMREREPAHGTVTPGANARPGYYRQGTEHLDDRRSVLDELLATRNMPLQEARDLLARFLFRGEAIDQPVGTLSGGERSRLALAKLSADDVNLLLLDEPTNHLDIASREALEAVLDGYQGTILFVTHDRALIQNLATKTWLIQHGAVSVLDGG
ncbi:MAG TPA: ABC-F family ATP-binding cassette domain-containing protein, partial [Dehalococcoidia bacterium]